MKAKNVQTIFCLVILFLFVGKAQAAEWIFYNSSATSDLYYDKTSIKKYSNTVRIWTKRVYNEKGKMEEYSFLKSIGKAPENPTTLSFEVSLDVFDCVNESFRTLSLTIYNDKGQIIASQSGATEWNHIIPDSLGEQLKYIACSGGKKTKGK